MMYFGFGFGVSTPGFLGGEGGGDRLGGVGGGVMGWSDLLASLPPSLAPSLPRSLPSSLGRLFVSLKPRSSEFASPAVTSKFSASG